MIKVEFLLEWGLTQSVWPETALSSTERFICEVADPDRLVWEMVSALSLLALRPCWFLTSSFFSLTGSPHFFSLQYCVPHRPHLFHLVKVCYNFGSCILIPYKRQVNFECVKVFEEFILIWTKSHPSIFATFCIECLSGPRTANCFFYALPFRCGSLASWQVLLTSPFVSSSLSNVRGAKTRNKQITKQKRRWRKNAAFRTFTKSVEQRRDWEA